MAWRAWPQWYVSTWWLAPAVTALAFAGVAATELLPLPLSAWAANAIFYVFVASCVGLAMVALYNLVKERWLNGFVHLVSLVGTACAFVGLMVVSVLASMFGPSEDHFADHLVIPEGIEVAETKPPIRAFAANGDDAASPDWKTARQLLPAGSVAHGPPALELREGMQPGIYDTWVWANPGEPGMVYLKAFEVTQGTPLSEGRLRAKSSEWIGWSDDPSELFLANSNVTIYEGDWGKPYAARFEVWFVPDSGQPERKLMEKVFKIEGWER